MKSSASRIRPVNSVRKLNQMFSRLKIALAVEMGSEELEAEASVPGRCCFRGLIMRLVSLWWELSPWLSSITQYDF
jgi:hypothetical protein